MCGGEEVAKDQPARGAADVHRSAAGREPDHDQFVAGTGGGIELLRDHEVGSLNQMNVLRVLEADEDDLANLSVIGVELENPWARHAAKRPDRVIQQKVGTAQRPPGDT